MQGANYELLLRTEGDERARSLNAFGRGMSEDGIPLHLWPDDATVFMGVGQERLVLERRSSNRKRTDKL